MLVDMASIVWHLAQSPLAVFFGMIFFMVAVTVAIAHILHLQENYS